MKAKTIFIALLAALTSCESMDLVPKSQGNTESWYTSETELGMASNDFYILGYWAEPLSSSEQWTDNTTYRSVNRNPGSNGTVLDGTLNGQQYEVYALWQQSYKLIARCNTMLENIHKAEGNVRESVIRRYEGEARFCRACKYADLVFFYGDVPYLERTETIEEAEKQGRMPKSELIPLIYADFDSAIASLPATYGASEAIHATKGAALAMKARFALYMGDYAVAEQAAKQCIDLGIYSLEPDYAKLFKQSTKVNPEKVFVLPRSIENEVLLDSWVVKNGLPRNAGGYGSFNPSWDLLAAYLCTDGLPIDESPLFDPRKPFKNRDPRCTMTIVEFNTEHCGYEYDPSPAAKTVMNYTTQKMQSNQDSRIVNQYASYDGLLWKKCAMLTCCSCMPRHSSSRTRIWTRPHPTSIRYGPAPMPSMPLRPMPIRPLKQRARSRCARQCALSAVWSLPWRTRAFRISCAGNLRARHSTATTTSCCSLPNCSTMSSIRVYGSGA